MQSLNTINIAINLLYKDNKKYISITRLKKLLFFIYEELSKSKKLDMYDICFNADVNSIENAILYNSNIFRLCSNEEMIYLNEKQSIEKLVQTYKLDNTICKIIDKFIK